jgi:hypothetical protein
MELLIEEIKPSEDIKFTFSLGTMELSDLKDELIESMENELGNNPEIFSGKRDKEIALDAIFGTLANWNIVIE